MNLYNVKITAIRKEQYTDLPELYENPIEHACDVREGDSWIAVGGQKPEGLCDSAWTSIMKRIKLLIVILLGMTGASGQDSLTLTFSYQTTDGSYLQPDSITIENLTRNWSETLYYPDTVYTFILHTGIPNRLNDNGIQVMPNPFDGTTRVGIQSSKREQALIRISDITGRVCVEYSNLLMEGDNLFSIALTHPQTYILSVQTSSGTRSTKLTNTGHASANRIRHEGLLADREPELKSKSISPYEFEPGDRMRYRGYSPSRVSSVVTKYQFTSEQINLVFDMHGVPCDGQPFLYDYDGNIYSTVQIGNQCWMKENLRTSHFPDGTEIPVGGSVSLGDTAPYYCDFLEYYNLTIPWEERGNFYNWYAALGACPSGWHLPNDSELTALTDYITSQTEYICENTYHYTYYIAKSLASTSWWNGNAVGCDIGADPSSNNATGFSGIPAGFCLGSTSFGDEGDRAYFWSSTENNGDNAYVRYLFYYSPMVYRHFYEKILGRSVRCLRD